MRSWKLSLFTLALLSLSACELRLATDVTVERRGSGTLEVAVALDEELDGLLREAGVDVIAGLDEVREHDRDWEIDHRDGDDGREVRLRARFDDPDDLGDLADRFHEGLDGDDPRLWERLRLRRLEDRSFELTGRVGFLPPSSPGARGSGVSFDEEAFRRLMEERGDEFVRYDLRVTFPEPPVSHDADEVQGESLVWRAPIGELREVSARSEPVPRILRAAVVATALVAFLGALLVGVLVRRWRRGSSR